MRKRIVMAVSLISMLLAGCTINGSGSKAAVPQTVYVTENGSYVPYYLMTENYDGKSLLLRVEPLETALCYSDNNTYGSIGGYYGESELDEFLNKEFIRRFSEDFLAVVGETSIEIAKKDAIWQGTLPVAVEKIKRKFFALSASEMGIKSSMMAKEGTALQKVSGIVQGKVQWLRSAYLADDVSAWVWGEGHYGGESVASEQYVRPAFTLEKTVSFEKKEVEGKEILVPIY